MPAILMLPRAEGSAAGAKRGVVVFSHKEAIALGEGLSSRPAYFNALIARLDALQKSRFALGVHLGFRLTGRRRRIGIRRTNFRISRAITDSRWEFILSHRGLMAFSRSERRRIDLVSANFVPRHFSDGARPLEDRPIDITTIATSAPYKRWPDFFRVAERILLLRPDLRITALAVVRSDEELREIHSLASKALTYPTFSLQTVLPVEGSKGLPESHVRELLADSKAFVLFSRAEGTSKVIFEASMSGCSVWATRSYYFSTLRFIYSRHLRILSPNVARTARKLIRTVSRSSYHANFPVLAAHFSEESSVARLTSALSATLGQEVIIDYPANLRFRLPNQTLDQVFWRTGANRGAPTADLVDFDDFASFVSYLEDLPCATTDA